MSNKYTSKPASRLIINSNPKSKGCVSTEVRGYFANELKKTL